LVAVPDQGDIVGREYIISREFMARSTLHCTLGIESKTLNPTAMEAYTIKKL
jgi:hypothetical protein